MISPLLLLSALTVFCYQPPKAELVLKETYLISSYSISDILPLNKQYLCLSTFGGEIKIFDRIAKKVVFSEESLWRMLNKAKIHTVVAHKQHLYTHVNDTLSCHSFEWKDKTKPPTIGPAKLLDLKGQEVKRLWGTDTAAFFLTTSNKIYWLEDGRVLWDKVVDVPKLSGQIMKDVEGIDSVWLVRVGAQAKMLVCPGNRLQVFDFATLKKEKEYSLPGHPCDVSCSKDRFFILFIMSLCVMDLKGNIKDSDTYDYREITYMESKNLLLLSGIPQYVSFASTDGELGKDFKIPAPVGYPFVDGTLVYFGFFAYDRSDTYVGGGYLRVYEIK